MDFIGWALSPFSSLLGAQALERASQQSCETLRHLFQLQNACPHALLVHDRRPHIAILPSRFGRRRLLVVTDALVAQLPDAGLRFVVGREIGRAWLHHGDFIAAWTLQRFLRKTILLPLHVLGVRLLTHPQARTGEEIERRVQLRHFIDAVADACDIYRGLRSGRWPGLTDLDVDSLWSADLGRLPVHGEEGLFTFAAVCSRLRAPGGAWALGAGVAGSVTPRLLAEAFSLSRQEEKQVRRCLRFGTWGLGLWAAKARAEVFSADRLGLIAAGGDLDAALRAMVAAASSFNDIATAALLGLNELVRQAQYLSSVMPPSYLSRQPSLAARVADLSSWARSPLARTAFRRQDKKSVAKNGHFQSLQSAVATIPSNSFEVFSDAFWFLLCSLSLATVARGLRCPLCL